MMLAHSKKFERWKKAVDPVRVQLAPELRSRVESLECFLALTDTGVLDSRGPGWSHLKTLAVVNVSTTAERFTIDLPPEPSLLPPPNGLKDLAIRGQQLGTGVDELTAFAHKRLFHQPSQPGQKWLVGLAMLSALFGQACSC